MKMTPLTKAANKAIAVMMWRSFKRGFLWKPSPSADELLDEFYQLVDRFERKDTAKYDR